MSFSTASSFGMEYSANQSTGLEEIKQLFDDQFAELDVTMNLARSDSECSCCDVSCCDVDTA